MTDKEIIRALRVCSRRTDAQTCAECPLFDSEDCMGDMMVGAADLIERLTAENAEAEAERDALIEQIKERHDCMDCKHNDYCEFDDANVIDCMNCVKGNCPCAQCCDSSRWEWRGLPEAPKGGEKDA